MMADVETTARFPPLRDSSPLLHGAGDEAERWPRLPRCASGPWRFLQRAPIASAQPSGALEPLLSSLP
eukprot:scaffold18848_cov62-Phaeocystis_antarctica.AAC.5